jgi:surface carbohydrate biosynthesis protein
MEKLLFLPIETIARELDSKLLLAHRALSRDYSVIIGRKENVFKAAERTGYGIFFYKSHGRSSFPCVKNAVKSGFAFVALDEEGLVFMDDKSYIERAIPDKLEHLSIIFTWGQYQKNLLVKENPILNSKIIPVGNPRFDLLRSEFSPIYKSARDKISKKWVNYILVNTNFSAGNYSRNYGCSYIEHIEHMYIKENGNPLPEEKRDSLLKESRYYKRLFEKYKEMLTVVSKRFPELHFILRPHPSEDHENWKSGLKDLKNVNVIFEGSSIDWMQDALAVIHTGCTTGIEAWALKKPVIVYNPDPVIGIEPELPNKFGLNIKKIDDLVNVIDKIINKDYNSKFMEQLETAHLFIESIKGKLSAERIMDALEDLTNNTGGKPGNRESASLNLKGVESIKSSLKFRLIKWLRKYRPAMNRLLGKKIDIYIFKIFKKYPGLIAQFQKFPGLDARYIRTRLSIFDSIFNKNCVKNYNIKKIATDSYIINK